MICKFRGILFQLLQRLYCLTIWRLPTPYNCILISDERIVGNAVGKSRCEQFRTKEVKDTNIGEARNISQFEAGSMGFVGEYQLVARFVEPTGVVVALLWIRRQVAQRLDVI